MDLTQTRAPVFGVEVLFGVVLLSGQHLVLFVVASLEVEELKCVQFHVPDVELGVRLAADL